MNAHFYIFKSDFKFLAAIHAAAQAARNSTPDENDLFLSELAYSHH